MHGRGRYEWKDGRFYEGDWLNGKMHGRGTYIWTDGRKYEGEYHEDKKEGEGIFEWPDGKRYEGSWKDGIQHGLGKIIIDNKTQKIVKQGLFEEGKLIKEAKPYEFSNN